MQIDNSHVTELELKILQIIWKKTNCSVSDILENWMGSKKPGYTTILKTLQKMEKKSLAGHRSEGKKYLYFSRVTREQVTRNRLGTIIERIFTGDKVSFAQFFLDDSELGLRDLEQIRRLLDEAEQKKRGHHE